MGMIRNQIIFQSPSHIELMMIGSEGFLMTVGTSGTLLRRMGLLYQGTDMGLFHWEQDITFKRGYPSFSRPVSRVSPERQGLARGRVL